MLICPVCGTKLRSTEKSFFCENFHAFDKAKEGYVNLLSGKHKAGELIGDNKDMARARRLFLETGHYDFLADKICSMINKNDNVLDICCGEGYYTDYFRRETGAEVKGFDISKEMIKLAAKKYREDFFFVANIAHIPVRTEGVGTAIEICAPFSEKEFARILKRAGIFISVVPGKRHLWGLKELLYEKPYENNPDETEYELFEKAECVTVSRNAVIEGRDIINSLFAMTPYYYKTGERDKAKISGLERLETELEFDIRVLRKK